MECLSVYLTICALLVMLQAICRALIFMTKYCEVIDFPCCVKLPMTGWRRRIAQYIAASGMGISVRVMLDT
jgi:hypothetical protein